MAYARLSSSSQNSSTAPRFRCRHGLRQRAPIPELASWPERDRSCNERTLQRPSRRARRQCLLQEWLKNGWNDLDWAGEERMTDEERQCAADLIWAERAFKSERRFKG